MELNEAKKWVFSAPIKSRRTRIICAGCNKSSALHEWYVSNFDCRYCDDFHSVMECPHCPHCPHRYEVPSDQIIKVDRKGA